VEQKLMPAEIVIIAQVWVAQGRMDEALELLREDVVYTHDNEPRVPRFALHRDVDDPNHLTMIEAFPDQAALMDHRASPFYKDLMERLDHSGVLDRRERLVLEPLGIGDPAKGYIA
jgi:quinol monooxygenase YgiN